MAITAIARAKINWALDILKKREDGYHEMDMLMQSIELCDELRFEPSRLVTLTVGDRTLPSGEKNLVFRAAMALREYTGTRQGARIRLIKRIPVRAGLGGGSADCAAALIALNRLWRLTLTDDTLLALGAKLGADVPFCLRGGLARVGGFGERIRSIQPAPRVPLLIVRPGSGLSTASVFQRFDESGESAATLNLSAAEEALRAGDLRAASLYCGNALERPACRLMSEIGAAIEKMRAAGAVVARMSGSGSAVFGAFESESAAALAQRQIPGSILTQTCGEP